jgi:Flp pilus assembly protein TadD
MSLTSARSLPALGTIAVLSLGLTACGTLGDATAQRGQITLRVADAAMSSGAPDLALRVTDLVLAKQPDNAAALTARGDALYAMGKSGLAEQAYRAAVKSDPRFAGAQLGLGRTLIRTDPKAAEAAFLAASTMQRDNAIALSNLGVARDLQKHHAAAQEAYRAALAVAPEMSDVRVNLGLSLALSGQADAAVQILRPLATDPGATQIWHADLAVALARSGDLAGARRALLTPDDAAPAPAPAATASSDAPVAVPAPLVAVAQHDVPALAAVHAATPPAMAAAGTETSRPPQIAQTTALKAPEIAHAAVLPAPHAATLPAPHAATLPATDAADTTTPALDVAHTATPASDAAHTATPASDAARANAAPAGQVARVDQTPAVAAVETLVHPLLAAMVTTEQSVAPQAAAPMPAPATVAAADPAVPAVRAKAPGPAVAPTDAAAASPAVAPAAANPKVTAAPAPMVVAATSVPTPVSPAAPRVPAPAVVAAAPREPAPALVAAAPAPAPPVHAVAPAATQPGWTPWLQLAAVRSEHDVQYEWHRLQTRLPELLGGRSLTVSQSDSRDHTYWRLRTGDFANLADANALCLRIRSAGGNCFAVVTSGS